MGSGASKDDYKPNNLSEPPDGKENEEEEEDPDAMDETVSLYIHPFINLPILLFIYLC